MARGRMLNRSVADSEKVGELGQVAGPWAVVLHHRLIAFLDIDGNVRADAGWLRSTVMRRHRVSVAACRRYAEAIAEVGLAVRYADKLDHPYLHFPGFREHQPGLRADRERPEYPAPPADILAAAPRQNGGKKRGGGAAKSRHPFSRKV